MKLREKTLSPLDVWVLDDIAETVEIVTRQRVTGGRRYPGGVIALDFADDIRPFNPIILATQLNTRRIAWGAKKMVFEVTG